jgi:hypothetical protein
MPVSAGAAEAGRIIATAGARCMPGQGDRGGPAADWFSCNRIFFFDAAIVLSHAQQRKATTFPQHCAHASICLHAFQNRIHTGAWGSIKAHARSKQRLLRIGRACACARACTRNHPHAFKQTYALRDVNVTTCGVRSVRILSFAMRKSGVVHADARSGG